MDNSRLIALTMLATLKTFVWAQPEIPRFVTHDFSDLNVIEQISRFRSGAGHDYSDEFESCRSMKHYYAPYARIRENGVIPIYSPVDGVVQGVQNEGHGSSEGLTNKQVRIRSTQHDRITFVLFHVDLASTAIRQGASVKAGERIGTARRFYPDLNEVAHSFDIAVYVDSPQSVKYISYMETLTDAVFDTYRKRGGDSRQTFIISEAERDADPLECDEQRFLTHGALSDWVKLNERTGE